MSDIAPQSVNPYQPPQHEEPLPKSADRSSSIRHLVFWILAAAILQCGLTVFVLMVEFDRIDIGIHDLPLYQLFATSAVILIASLIAHFRLGLLTAAWSTQALNLTQWAAFLITVMIMLNGVHYFGSNQEWTSNDTRILATTVFSLAGAIALMSSVKWLLNRNRS